MAPLLPARDISLEEVRSRFNLQEASKRDFFTEWRQQLPDSTDLEKQQLARIRQNYANLFGRQNCSEEAVKMVVLSSLLDLAGFYQAPFGIQTEESIEIVAEDDGLVVRGKVDVLVVQQQFWVLVIESKRTRFDVLTALPQALTYLLSVPNKADDI